MPFRIGAKDNPLDTVRFLAQKQECFSSEDVSELLSRYFGPPGLVEWVLSKNVLDLALFDSAHDPITYPRWAFATALRSYAIAYLAEYKFERLHCEEPEYHGVLDQWESLIRRLLRTGADVHECIYHCAIEVTGANIPYEIAEYRTPLDEMFTDTNTLAESRAVANGWLEILRSEGYDVVAYIEKEHQLHYTRPQIILPRYTSYGDLENPRELLFIFNEENPGISWDWWVDPASSTYLIRSTFKQMLMLSHWVNIDKIPWEENWPFRHPPWHEAWLEDHGLRCLIRDEEAWIKFRQLRNAALLRANRRLQKRHAKEMRRRGLKYPRMPGAWHD